MEQQPHQQNRENYEKPPTVTPRIYVASLSDYNNGLLHGAWIDATQDIGSIYDAINAMLKHSPDRSAEEYAIHDYDGFYGFRVGEYESLETVQRIAEGIADHGEAFAAFVDTAGTEEATLDTFEERYRGTYASMDAFLDEFIDSMGWADELEKFGDRTGMGGFVSINYADLEAVIRMEWEVIEGDDGVHVFWQ